MNLSIIREMLTQQIPVDTEHPLWPYYAAIFVLATTVSFLFGLLMKQGSKFSARLEEIHENRLKMDEERSKRIHEEFEKKDKAILETSVEFARLMERVAAELAGLNDRDRR
jgi:hypothetical protein